MSAQGSFTGKVCVVTGATSGLGKAIATELATLGGTVVLVARDLERANRVREEIVARQTGEVHIVACDLSSQSSIRAAARELMSRFPKIDVLVNQAGLVENERRVTVDGLEAMFAVNHLAYFMLTNLLADALVGGVVLNSTGGDRGSGKHRFR